MPESLLNDVRMERAKYPTPIPPDRVADLLNAVAWKGRAAGWGLSRKPGGSHAVRWDGEPIASDILHHRPTNTLYDVLRDAEGVAEPTWGEVGPPPSDDRTWVAPIPPRDVTDPPDEPPTDPPTDTGHAALAAQLADVQSRLATLHALLQDVQADAVAANQQVQAVADRLARSWPIRMTGKLFGVTVTLSGQVGPQE